MHNNEKKYHMILKFSILVDVYKYYIIAKLVWKNSKLILVSWQQLTNSCLKFHRYEAGLFITHRGVPSFKGSDRRVTLQQ